MGNICLYDEAFTKDEMRGETCRCLTCTLGCEYAGGRMGKPNIGVKPYYVAIPERIHELSQAIDRNADVKTGAVQRWAKEISLLSDVLRAMDFDV